MINNIEDLKEFTQYLDDFVNQKQDFALNKSRFFEQITMGNTLAAFKFALGEIERLDVIVNNSCCLCKAIDMQVPSQIAMYSQHSSTCNLSRVNKELTRIKNIGVEELAETIEKATCYIKDGAVYGAYPMHECKRIAQAVLDFINGKEVNNDRSN